MIEDETFALAGRKPLFELIGERELKLVLPAASPPLPEGIAARVAVRLTDSMGAGATLWFREMLGSSCIFDYRFDR